MEKIYIARKLELLKLNFVTNFSIFPSFSLLQIFYKSIRLKPEIVVVLEYGKIMKIKTSRIVG